MGDGCTENWMETSYAGLSFYNPQWKYLKLAFEFEHKGLNFLIFGFRPKDEDGAKREDVKDWEDVQKNRTIFSILFFRLTFLYHTIGFFFVHFERF